MQNLNLGGRPLRVLVVEDEALICMTLQDVLEDLGCEVVAMCSTVGEAAESVKRDDFDVAILDVNLNGEAITPVGAILRDRAIPFIFSTGYGKSGVPQDFNDYPVVEKPFRDLDIESSLHMAMKGLWERPKSNP
jgi:CheY-like chemotaxis protein